LRESFIRKKSTSTLELLENIDNEKRLDSIDTRNSHGGCTWGVKRLDRMKAKRWEPKAQSDNEEEER
jgi:hypothetical protein